MPLDDTRFGQWVTTQQRVEAKPEKFALAVAAVKPLVPTAVNFKLESKQRGVVPADPVDPVVPVEFLTQFDLLLADEKRIRKASTASRGFTSSSNQTSTLRHACYRTQRKTRFRPLVRH